MIGKYVDIVGLIHNVLVKVFVSLFLSLCFCLCFCLSFFTVSTRVVNYTLMMHSQDIHFCARISNIRSDGCRQLFHKYGKSNDIRFRARISNTRGDH